MGAISGRIGRFVCRVLFGSGVAASGLVGCVGLGSCAWPAAVLAAEEARADGTTLFADAFDHALGKGWAWIREAPGGWKIRNGALEIRSGVGTMDRATNLLVRDVPVEANQTIVMQVTVQNAPTEQYEQCGIVWYYNDRTYVKLVKEMVDGKSWIVMGCSLPPGGRLAGKVPFPKENVAQLRLAVRAGQIIGSQRQAGEATWHKVGKCALPGHLPPEPKISLQTFHGPETGDHWARFDNFSITRH